MRSASLATAAAILLVVLAVLPALLSAIGMGYLFRLVELTMIFAILAGSLNLVSGTAGLMSLGHAAFYGIGAYTAGLLSTQFGTGLVTDLAAATLVAGVVALIVAIPAIRLVRIFFTVATLAVGEIINAVLLNWDGLTRGPMGVRGIPPLQVGGLVLVGRMGTYYDVALVSLAALWVLYRLTHSYYGNALRALREDDLSAAAAGLDVRALKLSAFAISGALAGVAGCLQAHITNYISPDMFQLDTSILILTMVVVGGLGSLPGAVLGACILILVPELGRELGHFRMIAVGLVLYVSILLMPKGVIGEVWALRAAAQLRPGALRREAAPAGV